MTWRRRKNPPMSFPAKAGNLLPKAKDPPPSRRMTATIISTAAVHNIRRHPGESRDLVVISTAAAHKPYNSPAASAPPALPPYFSRNHRRPPRPPSPRRSAVQGIFQTVFSASAKPEPEYLFY